MLDFLSYGTDAGFFQKRPSAPTKPWFVGNTQDKGQVNRSFRLSFTQKISSTLFSFSSKVMPGLMAELGYTLWRRPRRRTISYHKRLPLGAQAFFVFHRGNRLQCFRWGDQMAPIVLLVHGWESHTGYMLPFVQPLIDLGYQVVTLDGPGHGLSERALTDVYDYGEAIKTVIQHTGPLEAIIAHSYGSAATLFMLANTKNLLPKKIVTVAPMVHLGIHLSIFQSLSGLSARGMEWMCAKIEHRFGIDCNRWHLLGVAPLLTVPTLILHDETDDVVPIYWGKELNAVWPEAKLYITRGLGHNRILRNQEVVRRAVRFIAAKRSAKLY